MLIGGYQPFSLSDFPGKTAAIIFTQGCNYRCPFCHNKQLWPMSASGEACISHNQILTHLSSRTHQLDGVVITGGEPTLQEGLAEFIDGIKQLNLAVKLDTNGSQPHILKELLDQKRLDYVAMDIKAPFDKYSKLAGLDVDTDRLACSVDIIRQSSIPHLFRTTFDKNHLQEKDLISIKEMVAGHPHLIQEYRQPLENET